MVLILMKMESVNDDVGSLVPDSVTDLAASGRHHNHSPLSHQSHISLITVCSLSQIYFQFFHIIWFPLFGIYLNIASTGSANTLTRGCYWLIFEKSDVS